MRLQRIPPARRLGGLLLAIALVTGAPARAQSRIVPALSPPAPHATVAPEKPPAPPKPPRPSEAMGPWLIGAGVLGMLAIWLMRRVRDS